MIIIELYVVLALLLAGMAYLYTKHRWALLSNPVVLLSGWIFLGFLFATTYAIVDLSLSTPGHNVFNPEFYFVVDPLERGFQYVYFSFITIATVGYGDFAPSHPVARFLVIIESAFGLLIVAAFAGSVIHKLSQTSAIFYVDKFTLTLLENDNLEIFFSLDGGNYSIDNLDMTIFSSDQDGTPIEEYSTGNMRLLHERTVRRRISWNTIYHAESRAVSQKFYLLYSVTSMSFTNSLWIAIDNSIMEEIHAELEGRKLLTAPDPVRREWNIDVTRGSSAETWARA